MAIGFVDEQIEARLKLRRSVFSARDAEAGTSIGDSSRLSKPGHGIPPNDWEDLCKSDRYLNKTVAAGEMLTLDVRYCGSGED